MLLFIASAALADGPTHASLESADWTIVTTASSKDVGEVQVYKSVVAGVDCFRGTAVTDVAAPKLLDVVADVEGATRWSSAGVTEAKLLARQGDRLEYYQYLDVPGWTMASDRFWFLSSSIERSGPKIAFRWQPLAGGGAHASTYQSVVEAHPGAVEPPVNVGGWYFEERDDGVHVTYQVCTKPGGSIPVAIQNAATKKTLPDTVGDVVREAKNR